MSSLETYIRQLASEGIRINLWPTAGGLIQAGVSERAGRGWTCVTDADPVYAITEALRQRHSGTPSREIVIEEDEAPRSQQPVAGAQVDIEEAIAAADVEFEGLIG